MLNSENEIIIYDDGNVELSTRTENEIVWLTQKQPNLENGQPKSPKS